MTIDAAVGEAADGLIERFLGLQKIAEEYGAAIAGQRLEWRQAAYCVVVCQQVPLRHGPGQKIKRVAPGARRHPVAEGGHMLAAAYQQRGQGQGQQIGARRFFRQIARRCIIHGRGRVAPNPDALRRFPFVFTDKNTVGTGRSAPIDLGDRIAPAIMPVLPEGFALADPAAPVDALGNGRRHPVRRHHQGRQIGR